MPSRLLKSASATKPALKACRVLRRPLRHETQSELAQPVSKVELFTASLLTVKGRFKLRFEIWLTPAALRRTRISQPGLALCSGGHWLTIPPALTQITLVLTAGMVILTPGLNCL